MKTTVWIFTQDNWDGSSSALFFNSKADAEAYAEGHLEKCDYDIYQIRSKSGDEKLLRWSWLPYRQKRSYA